MLLSPSLREPGIGRGSDLVHSAPVTRRPRAPRTDVSTAPTILRFPLRPLTERVATLGRRPEEGLPVQLHSAPEAAVLDEHAQKHEQRPDCGDDTVNSAFLRDVKTPTTTSDLLLRSVFPAQSAAQNQVSRRSPGYVTVSDTQRCRERAGASSYGVHSRTRLPEPGCAAQSRHCCADSKEPRRACRGAGTSRPHRDRGGRVGGLGRGLRRRN